MLKLKTLLAPTAFCLSLALAGTALAKHHGNHHRDGMRQIFSQLSLTDEQKQDLKQIRKQGWQDASVFKADMKALKQQLRAIVQTDEWNEQAAKNTLTQHQDILAQIGLLKATSKHDVWNRLTEDQQAQFNQIIADKKAAWAEKDPEERKRKGKGKRKGGLLKGLDLSEDQQATIEQIKSTAKEARQTFKPTRKAFKQAERALIQSSEFDQESWQTLKNQYQDAFLTAAIAKAKTKHDIWNTLTAEQQAQVQAKMAKRKGKWKHRG